MFKFAPRNFAGKEVRFYLVDDKTLPAATPTKERIGHHILVVDASGSMYGDIDHIKEKLRKMLTLDEYRDSSMLVSLFSYSSSGDLIEHFTRVPVGDIVKSRNTKAQREIGSLRARGATCMTQAFRAALDLANLGSKDELTAVSLHTDGYFNDPSPSAEFREVDRIIEEFKKVPNTFVNTIGYRDYCDFKLLNKIANALSGKCWQAKDLKSFYDSIYDTTALLAGETTPALYLERKGSFDYHVFVSSDGKLVGGSGDLVVNGVKSDAIRRVFEFKEVTSAEYKKAKHEELSYQGQLAFAAAQLAEGRVNLAKYALVSTRLSDLVFPHAKALTNKALAALAEDLHRCVCDPNSIPVASKFPTYGLKSAKGYSIPDVLSILDEYRGDWTLDLDFFVGTYKRRGVKRLAGTRDDSGNLVKPKVHSELREKERFVPVSSFDFNRANATINMTVARPCKLVDSSTNNEIAMLAGLKLDLSDFRQYTLVGDGELNVQSLVIKITNKKLFSALGCTGKLDPESAYSIDLHQMPLVDYSTKFDASDLDPNRLAMLHAFDKIFGSLLKDKSTTLTDEMIAKLREYYITPSLYLSLPSTNPYTDIKKAISDGEIDTRLSYEVYVGTPDMLKPSDLWSANEFLRRWYEVTGKNVDEKKPAMQSWFEKDFSVKHKQLSSRVKVTSVDKLMATAFDEFFGIEKPITLKTLLTSATLKKLQKAQKTTCSTDDKVDAIGDARKEIAAALEAEYRKHVSPLVFYIGASGLVPDDFGDVQAMSAEQLLKKYPNAPLEKAMKEDGAFYDIGGGIILTVLTRAEYFSTERGVERAKEQEAKAA